MRVLDATQKGVLRGILLALLTTVLVLLIPVVFGVDVHAEESQVQQQIRLAVWAALLLAIPLVVTIAALARLRFFSTTDIHGGGLSEGSERARVLQAVLQNTVEQVVLAMLVHAVWILTAPPNVLAVSLFAAVLFFVGRTLFAMGYARGAPHRAFGFGLTFYPTVVMLIAVVVLALM